MELAIKNGRNFLGTQKMSCPNCGRVYTVSLFNVFREKMEKTLACKWKEKEVMIWGMGEEGYKFLYNCKQIEQNNVFLADKNSTKCREVEGKNVGNPEDILREKSIDIILIGTNAPIANNSIKKEAKERRPDIMEVYNLNDYLNDIALDNNVVV